jgi:sugar lactone lactonase YvrE
VVNNLQLKPKIMKFKMNQLWAFTALLPFLLACDKSDTTDPLIAKDELSYVLTELGNSAALHGANGIDIGPDGNLYIGSVIGLEIVVMDKDNGTIIDRLGQDKGVSGADDLVFGPDGSLYWTDILIGEVGRRTPEGVVTKQYVAPGVNPITFSADGRLFVALDFQGDGLYELDPNLIEPPRPIIQATEENPYPLGFFNAFDFCADGRLFGPLFAAAWS